MASAAQIAAAQKLADEMAAAAAAEDSDDAPLESLVTVRNDQNGAANREDASDDEVMPTPKRRGPPADGDAALAAKKPLPDFRRDGPRVGETIQRKVERPTGPAWAEGKIIGYLGPDESTLWMRTVREQPCTGSATRAVCGSWWATRRTSRSGRSTTRLLIDRRSTSSDGPRTLVTATIMMH